MFWDNILVPEYLLPTTNLRRTMSQKSEDVNVNV